MSQRANTFIAAIGAVRSGALVYDDLDTVTSEQAAAMVTSAADELLTSSGFGLVTSSEASYLSSMIAQSDCKYVPLVQGQLLALPVPVQAAPSPASGAGDSGAAAATSNGTAARAHSQAEYRFFRVTATHPRFTAVIVSPETKLDYQA